MTRFEIDEMLSTFVGNENAPLAEPALPLRVFQVRVLEADGSVTYENVSAHCFDTTNSAGSLIFIDIIDGVCQHHDSFAAGVWKRVKEVALAPQSGVVN